MNLSHLRCLVAVAETGSLTAAAEALGLTQSGASQAIGALEDLLGVPLIVRHRRGADLTDIGERVATHARDVMTSLDRVRSEVDAARGLAKGKLRLASFPTVFATLLPPLLRRFRVRHPGIEIVALETDDREVEAWLKTGAIDVGVVLNPTEDRGARLLGQDAWVAVLPAAHRWAKRRSLALAELAGEPFVLATGGCDLHAASLAEAEGVQLRDVRVEVRDWNSAFALVREGIGVCLVPELTLPEIRRGIRVIPLTRPTYRVFGLVPSPASNNLPLVEVLFSTLDELTTPDPSRRT